MPKYGELTIGQVEALVNRIGGMGNALLILRDEVTVTVTPKVTQSEMSGKGEQCPNCGHSPLYHAGYQTRCLNCGFVRCGH